MRQKSRQELCSTIPQRRVRIAGAVPASRLPGASGLSLRISLSLEVLSDYLFIGSGSESLTGLEAAAQHLDLERLGSPPEEVLAKLQGMVRALSPVKDFFRAVNPWTGRLEPAIPGTSLKGAARSRLELVTRDTGKGKVVAEFLYDSGPLYAPPRQGSHGWRHARIWCESLGETRSLERIPSVASELYGMASRDLSLQGKALFSTFYQPPELSRDCEPVHLDHGETLCVVPKGTVFRGMVDLVNVSLQEAGLLLYSLGFDKLLCGGQPRLLLGYSKYRCRRTREGVAVSFGIVGVGLEGLELAPWSGEEWGRVAGSGDATAVARRLVEEAVRRYPGLPRCFDEVSRRLSLEPCRPEHSRRFLGR